MAYCLKVVNEMDRFDTDYEEAKNEIKENLSFLENEFDMMAILAWISRLEEPASSPEEKAVRNEYCKYLAHQLSRQTLHYPFTEDPPQGKLQPLCVSMDNPICIDNKCRYEKPEGEPNLNVRVIKYRAKLRTMASKKGEETLRTPPPLQLPEKGGHPEEPACFAPLTSDREKSCKQPSSLIDSFGTTFSFHDEYAEDSWCKAGYTEWPLPQGSPIRPRSSHEKPCVGGKKFASMPGAPCIPCGPCEELAVSTPSSRLKKVCGPHTCTADLRTCPLETLPPPLPQGYLSKITEEDERPFLPPLPCTRENQSRLIKIVEAVDDETELYEFLCEVAPFTCDLGETMQYIASEELAHFKEFVKSVYQSRMADTQELLTKEHIKLKARYDEWESNVLRQAQAALRALKLMLPQFKYETYKRDPEYLYYMLRNQMSLEDTDVSPQARILRAKAQKKTWINEEAQRIEKDNMDRMIQMRELNAQLSALSKSYNACHKRLTETNKCLEDQAAQLRIRHDENQKLIDYLIDQLNTPPKTY